MAGVEVVVHERRPRWTPQLQRHLAAEGFRVRGCRSLADVAPGRLTPSVAILELEAAPAESLHFLARNAGSCPIIVIAGPASAELEWPIRELGATAVVSEDVSPDALANLCRRLTSDRSGFAH